MMQVLSHEFSVTENFITPEQEALMVHHITAEMIGVRHNDNGLRSKIIRFGYDYSDKDVLLRPAPDWIYPVASLREFESVTINQYLPGNRIAPHVDSLLFGSPILILSLLSSASFRLHPPTGKFVAFTLQPRSLASMSGEVREKWEHSVDKCSHRRFSVVYRKRL